MEPIIDYAAEQHCVLCRNKIQFYSSTCREYDEGDDLDKVENWETAVLALGFTDPKTSGDANTIPHVFFFEAHIVFLEAVYWTNSNMRVCIEPCGTPNTAGPIFFVHSACRELAQMSESKPSSVDLYNLGLQLRETMPRDCFKALNPWHLASFASGSTIADSEWKSLLMKCAQLPAEIQGRILCYANADKTTFSFLTGLTTSSPGIVSSSAVSPHPDSIPDLMSSFNTKSVYLCGSFNNIFGVDYLCHVESLNAPIHCEALSHRRARIEVNIDRIRSIEFVLGPVGILALRFHSTDGPKSSWLGSAAQGWRCGPIDITLEDINLLKNGHKNVLNQLAHAYQRQFGDVEYYSEELLLRVFWDVARDLPGSGESFLGEMYKDGPPHSRVLNSFTAQAMCSYLPLRENGVPVKGITVYACSKGTNSVIVHTRSSDLEVSATGRRGTPTSFYFRDGEEIVTMGLAAFDDYTDQSFDDYMDQSGPYLMLENKLTMFGAHCESRQYPDIPEKIAPLPEWQVTHPAMPDIVAKSWLPGQVKMTTAELTNIKQLRVQYRLIMPENALRCAGLLIHHTDGSIESVGCWDGSLTIPSELIYDSETDGELFRLVFHMKFRPYLNKVNEASYYMSKIVAHASRLRVQRVVEYPNYIVDDEEFEPEESEPEDMEDEEMGDEDDDEDEEEYDVPAEKTFDWDINSPKLFITWCFTKKLDHIAARNCDMRYVVKLDEDDGELCKIG
ncbi:hypothetical protein TGAM01_v201809 [Trichoderma gamsii]|uniref:Uncharacterized protein n=1 Tax=Trichoderma gamsii TaxID=398673 RepID=A0A2P4ZZ42_9HYPO|nr:hypothetical protein TGAM01_v201809 [Trichoderma gamsii]PON29560.1 hypothetical protein TGAM01_v201809 [Trichoderma gamsii]